MFFITAALDFLFLYIVFTFVFRYNYGGGDLMKKIKITHEIAKNTFLAAAFAVMFCVIVSLSAFSFEMTGSLSLFFRDAIGCSAFSFTLYLGVHISEVKKR